MICRFCKKEIDSENLSCCPYCYSSLKKESVGEENNNRKNINFFESSYKLSDYANNPKKDKFKLRHVIYVFVALFWVVAIFMLINSTNGNFYFKGATQVLFGQKKEEPKNEQPTENKGNNQQTPNVEPSNPSTEPSNSVLAAGETSIIYNRQYLKKMVLTSEADVNNLIVTDSVNQKSNCSQEIIAIENEIITRYNITAVNLCEMDVNFARELRNVISYVYNTFPTARGKLTNVTLANVDANVTYMAAFMPIYTFATSNTASSYPVGVKSQIILNAKYFLNKSKIQNSVSYGVSSGYFPPNATRSSTVAHEFGHYISYVAMMKSYSVNKLLFVNAAKSSTLYDVYDDFNYGNFSYKILSEAYQTYCSSYGATLSFDQFRQTISQYAMAKDKQGKYIYDETIAEAFHDCYLNGENAKEASKVIISTLKKYL